MMLLAHTGIHLHPHGGEAVVLGVAILFIVGIGLIGFLVEE